MKWSERFPYEEPVVDQFLLGQYFEIVLGRRSRVALVVEHFPDTEEVVGWLLA